MWLNQHDDLSRRAFLVNAIGGTVGLCLSGPLAFGLSRDQLADVDSDSEQPLIGRVLRPLDAETPVNAFHSWLTPNHRFFVRSHFGPPAGDLAHASALAVARSGTRRPSTHLTLGRPSTIRRSHGHGCAAMQRQRTSLLPTPNTRCAVGARRCRQCALDRREAARCAPKGRHPIRRASRAHARSGSTGVRTHTDVHSEHPLIQSPASGYIAGPTDER